MKRFVFMCVVLLFCVVSVLREPNIKEVLGYRDISPNLDGKGIVEPNEWTKMCSCFDAKEEYKDFVAA